MARTALGRERSAGRSASALAQGASGRRSAMKPKFAKKLWKKEEDAVLLGVVPRYLERHGKSPEDSIEWPVIAAEVAAAGVQGRTHKSCRLRWESKLRGNILDLKLHPFTPQEDDFILEAMALWTRRRTELGNALRTPWNKMASCLPGRSDNQLKNRWHSHLRKRAGWVPTGPPRGGWTHEEVQREAGLRKFEAMLARIEPVQVVYVPAAASSPAPPPTPPQEPVQRESLVPASDGIIFPDLGDDLPPLLGDDLEDFLAVCGFLASDGEAPVLAECATAVPPPPQ